MMPSSMALLILHRNFHGRTSSLLQARLFSCSPEAAAAAAAAAKRRASEPKPVEKILVANRCEIDCRIMRTARRLGVRTVTVNSDADAGGLHVRSADEALRIGPAPTRLSYLSGASIVEAALRARAQTLMRAIEKSCIAIVIFFEDHASSWRCLEELLKIMECKAQKKLIVLLVFYKVEPREVRGGREVCGRAMAKHEPKFGKDSETVKRWTKALSDASNLSGWDFNDG